MNRMRLLFGLLLLVVVTLAPQVGPVPWLRDRQLPQQIPEHTFLDRSHLAQTGARSPHIGKFVEPKAVHAIADGHKQSSDEARGQHDTLVPPIQVARRENADSSHATAGSDAAAVGYRQDLAPQFTKLFAHGKGAIFEPHGDEVCASGCAASRHATDKLSESRFLRLLSEYVLEPCREGDQALETLLFYGPQTRALLGRHSGRLDRRHSLFLLQQLQFSHARVSLRLVDDQGTLRSWIEPTIVPLDRRHLFKMRTKDMPAQVVSGTVKRVGLNHLWTRL